MKKNSFIFLSFLIACTIFCKASFAQVKNVPGSDLHKLFQSPPESAKPWVFWYWMNGAVSAEGITADLEAMKAVGIGGAYLMPIKDTTTPPLFTPVARQLSPQWWKMVKHSMEEAKRLDLKIAMHASDGFALAGGPWITPALSMQKVVWSKKQIQGGKLINEVLPSPERNENYYKDIAIYAYPSPEGAGVNTQTRIPQISTNKPGADSISQLLVDPNNTKTFSCDDACWIQYEFDQPFTCRSITVKTRNNYQANRFIIEVSDDGKTFRSLGRLETPRHGWQDWDSDYTHAIPPVTARYFRFIYNKEGSEPGAEDLDAAKWKPSFKVTGIELSSEAKIHQYQGKNGEVWRVSKRTTEAQIPASLFISKDQLINISAKVDKEGRLIWDAPAGEWTIIRMGHTSTGHKNETGGGGKGLECDKFNPVAITKQFNGWFGEAIKQVGPTLAAEVLKVFHVDSWECGSQNWSPVFQDEFKKRRGYDIVDVLPVMAGLPVENAAFSEKALYDVRQTIAELVNDVFYATFRDLAHAKGTIFTAESVAPTMMSDGMLHYQNVDIPMGEFWLRSPTHDKPNDMSDAISGAHIYGKNIIQAEGFTELRMYWDEHPGMLKALADRNFALGINKLVFHVFTHNPWMNRKPGMTLDDVGLYFQRDQTWWKQSKAWIDYIARCQALLQFGKPVVDIAVFTGEELPRRSVLPDRLVSSLPGIFGEAIVQREAKRLANEGQPLRQLPIGVSHSANVYDPADWIDPLNGYSYDSYNVDALLRLSTVENGKIILPGGANYQLLVVPGAHPLVPNGNKLSAEVSCTIQSMVNKGATVLLPTSVAEEMKDDSDKGKVLKGPYTDSSFDKIGLAKDFIATEAGSKASSIAWTHRAGQGVDIYFISNQEDKARTLNISLRVEGKIPELWDAVTGEVMPAKIWKVNNGRTELPIKLEASGSVFIVLKKPATAVDQNIGSNWKETKPLQQITAAWTVRFDTSFGGPKKPVIFKQLQDWSKHDDPASKHYSGTAVYTTTVNWKPVNKQKQVWLNVEKVANIATVKVNGIACGTIWTAPYKVDITKALRAGKNVIEITVANTWANRLLGDLSLPEKERLTNTTAPLRPLKVTAGKTLLEAGLLGPVLLEE